MRTGRLTARWLFYSDLAVFAARERHPRARTPVRPLPSFLPFPLSPHPLSHPSHQPKLTPFLSSCVNSAVQPKRLIDLPTWLTLDQTRAEDWDSTELEVDVKMVERKVRDVLGL